MSKWDGGIALAGGAQLWPMSAFGAWYIYKEQHKTMELYLLITATCTSQPNYLLSQWILMLSQWLLMFMLLSASSRPPTKSSEEPVLRFCSYTTRYRQPRQDTTVPELRSAWPSDTPTISSWPAWMLWKNSSTHRLLPNVRRSKPSKPSS